MNSLVCGKKKASTGSKLVQKVSLGSIADKRVEFVRMKGPGVSPFVIDTLAIVFYSFYLLSLKDMPKWR